jgi:hypothetical protein
MHPLVAVAHRVRAIFGCADTRPRLVRRTTFRCPHGRGLATAEFLMSPTGRPQLVLGCNRMPGCPPGCDQECRVRAEAITAPVDALIILPPGDRTPEDLA